ncbi:SDR family oxidoreductase [Caulobacter sp. S45]|uniref:SDR family oxidoreductase n=1 Tax=Caulobacter sp. S45 TaxID=1641861 RepID=UPI00131CA15F|nr:SDR family oxidoreductase [Caulobacter sp. S45]
MTKRVVLVGATGVFGSRLAAMLADMPEIELVLAARNLPALEHLRDVLVLDGGATVSTVSFDRAQPEMLGRLQPWLVVDVAGPFQDSGYDLAETSVSAGAHYIDISDGRAFVAGFAEALGPGATVAGVLAVTGASSTPALSHAALHQLCDGWRRLDEVRVVISPGARAPRGLAVVQAILSYVGLPVWIFRDGCWSEAAGWSGLRRVRMPGLGSRWASICETPDLDLLPACFPVQGSALFMAGLELAPMHLGLAFLGWTVRLGLVRSLAPLAPLLRAAAGLFVPFGSDRGGMIVEAKGRDGDDEPIYARWALCADANAGPNTPVAPIAALIRAMLEGREARRGAMTAAGLLPLEAIVRELDPYPITTIRHESHPSSPALYRRLLGRRFAELPMAVQAVHAGMAPMTFRGDAVARAGSSFSARIMRRVLGLPSSGRSDVEVKIAPDERGETWTRRFGAARFSSRLVQGRELGAFEERFGPLRFGFDLQPSRQGVTWVLSRWGILGLDLPLGLAPLMRARAQEEAGRYRFRVVVAHPWLGLLFAYRGLLADNHGRRLSNRAVALDGL